MDEIKNGNFPEPRSRHSDIEYLAMMTDNELEQEETDDAGEEI